MFRRRSELEKFLAVAEAGKIVKATDRLAIGQPALTRAIAALESRFARFLDDGRIFMTNNAAERALRGIALGRRAWLFAGSDRGACGPLSCTRSSAPRSSTTSIRKPGSPMDDPQLRHIDHAWSSTVHGAQGSTADGVIAVLDSSHGALTDQSTFYVEISRARDRAVVLTDNAEQLVKVLADNTGERPTAIEAVDAPIELEPEEIVRLLADKEPVWTPREEWEALERRARREGTVLFLVDGYGEPIGGARELAENPDLPTLTREVVDGLLAYDRACREGDKAAVEFLGLLDEHDARRRGLDGAAAAAECPVAGLEDYPDWREMSGRLSANGKALLAELGERAGEAGDTISRRLGRLADLLAVDDAVLDFNTRRREVVARAAAEGTIPFYAEGHDDLVERARELAKLSGLPAWALAAAKEVVAHAEACEERKAGIVALHVMAAGLLDDRRKLENRARTARRSAFTPPTELAGYANWLARCGEVGERWRAMREDPDTWQPHARRWVCEMLPK